MANKGKHEVKTFKGETRKLVDWKIPPYPAVALLEFFVDSDLKNTGTGFLVKDGDTKFIVTNAHLFFFASEDDETKGKKTIKEIQIAFGAFGARVPYSVLLKEFPNHCRFPKEYSHQEPDPYDFGIILLDAGDNRFLPSISFELSNFKTEIGTRELCMSGYPDEIDVPGKEDGKETNVTISKCQFWTPVNPIDPIPTAGASGDEFLSYKDATSYGNSGSPIFYKENDKFVVVGIHCIGDDDTDTNVAVRINEAVKQRMLTLLEDRAIEGSNTGFQDIQQGKKQPEVPKPAEEAPLKDA